MIILSELSAPTEGVRIQQPQVSAFFENQCAGEGTLTVAEGSVTWLERASGRGFSLSYPSIILHAVSTDLSSFPHECVYVLVDATKSDLNLADTDMNEGEEEEDEDEPKNVSIRFVPADTGMLQQIYKEMCECQELNPDEGDDFSDEECEDEGGIMQMGAGAMPPGRWFTADNLENAELSEEGMANLQRMMGGGGGQNGHNGTARDSEGENGMEE